MKNFCFKKEYFVFPSAVVLTKASDHCVSLGGQVAAPSNENENEMLLKLIKEYPECLEDKHNLVWIGVGIPGLENQTVFNKLEDHIRDLENDAEDVCVTMRSDGSWNTYHDCNSIYSCHICEFDRVPNFLAKGFCAAAPVNWIYYLVQNGSEYYYEGYKRDKIVQSSGGWIWNLADGPTLLKLNPYSGGPIGRNTWIKEEAMYRECGYTDALISLSTCSLRDEFTCDNGDCIDNFKRCDDNTDCDDHSDENLCTVVQVDPDYRSVDPPKIKGRINFISTTITIIRFDDIALDGTMEITLNIAMTWSDPKLTFLNIMDDDGLNTTSVKDVSTSIQSLLWLPLDKIVHKNAVIGEILTGTNGYVRVIANTHPIDGDSVNPKEGKDIMN